MFSIIVEGLVGLVKREVLYSILKGFQVNEDVSYDLLQFGYGTDLLGEGSWANLWAIKSIVTGFEIVSSLMMKICKSQLYSI